MDEGRHVCIARNTCISKTPKHGLNSPFPETLEPAQMEYPAPSLANVTFVHILLSEVAVSTSSKPSVPRIVVWVPLSEAAKEML